VGPARSDRTVVDGQLHERLGDHDVDHGNGCQGGERHPQAGHELPFESGEPGGRPVLGQVGHDGRRHRHRDKGVRKLEELVAQSTGGEQETHADIGGDFR